MNTRFAIRQIPLFAWLLTIGLAAGWLLPNHYPPWLAFHVNAWVALALMLIVLRGLYISKESIRLDSGGWVLLILALIPLAQYSIGLLPLLSDVVLRSLYLFGAAAAYILARHWNRHEYLGAANHVFSAMAIAAALSVGLATYQWLGFAKDMGLMDIWVLPFAEGTRPYANMGQPNQLASLFLCGLLGVAWAWNKRQLSGAMAVCLAAWILWGVALTESRTAMLTLALGMITLFLFGKRYLRKSEITTLTLLFCFYIFCLFGKSYLAKLVGLDLPLSIVERSAGELRISLWKMSLDASLQSPWGGFGWGRSNAGYFLVYEKYRTTFGGTYFEQSHNLILDLALWVGWPFAIFFVGLGCLWIFRRVRGAKTIEAAILLMAIAVLIIHAMLEFPLHYGYFLWPFFVLAGSVSVVGDKDASTGMEIPRGAAALFIMGLLIALIIIVIDYLKVEESFSELRFQIARIGRDHNEALPETMILRDWPEAIALARKTPRPGMSEEEIRHWEALLMYNTSPLALRKVIGANRLNGKEAQAQAWANRACWLLPQAVCMGLIDEWASPAESASSVKQPVP
ncbi:O-antigen ligase [Acidovorax sp. 99]|uniref:PglL family O-oligosaccharyltransferase n=1 Tax=Acidovorax sp. 99 TaxID=2135634 RepID=UPI000D5CEFF5|nr:O-antigen ligase family protein [Acidovorax sp. 99]PVY90918.1 O-antigen ligase [Acidovorax sp. 99]